VPDLLLGLIGGNIAASSAPLLHTLAGRHHGIAVEYRRLVPRELGKTLPQILEGCAASGFAGVNITYPYKEEAVGHVRIADEAVEALGAVNTVLFAENGMAGHNTDHTGFIAVCRAAFGAAPPGVVGLIGAGGVGRAIAFGLAELGASEVRLLDQDRTRAARLSRDLKTVHPALRVALCDDECALADGADGLINGTPVGMHGQPGLPVQQKRIAQAKWVFDAVYTPVETPFLQAARAAGLTAISGFELFLHQGIDAWKLFSGLPIPEAALRAPLEQAVFGKTDHVDPGGGAAPLTRDKIV